MSNTSQGAGWWLASDGKWYPPEAWTGPPRQSDATPMTAGMYPSTVAPGSTAYSIYPTVSAPFHPGFAPVPSTNGMAVASLVLSCVGIVPFFFGITCILGIIFGFVARSQIRDSPTPQQGRGLALAGIIVGFSLIFLFILIIILVAALSNNGQSCVGSGINQFCTTN
jgi:hypothetical protein